MQYNLSRLPFRHHNITPGETLLVSESGDYAFLPQDEFEVLTHSPEQLSIARIAELKAKFILCDPSARGYRRLLASRITTKSETINGGPTLHILVPTLQCAHTCRYCQVSRSLDDNGFSISLENLEAACHTILESPNDVLTVEFQGGDPLLRFDLVRHAIKHLRDLNIHSQKQIRFVIASSLHQLNETMCSFLKDHDVFLSTSLDGPKALHNKNRPLPTRDAYERTIIGIGMARDLIGPHAVSALMTTTRESLDQPEAIVDEYVKQGFNEIFIRPLSPYGFARRNTRIIGYTLNEFLCFYERALKRVLEWNERGIEIREVTATILLNKILSPFDGGYVDLQSPTGAGRAVIVYNYDGFVYPSDEARMVAESGDFSLRLGQIGEPLENLRKNKVVQDLMDASRTDSISGCRECPYKPYCGPDPISSYAQYGQFDVPVHLTEHCQRHKRLFESFFRRLYEADEKFIDLAHLWAKPWQRSAHA